MDADTKIGPPSGSRIHGRASRGDNGGEVIMLRARSPADGVLLEGCHAGPYVDREEGGVHRGVGSHTILWRGS